MLVRPAQTAIHFPSQEKVSLTTAKTVSSKSSVYSAYSHSVGADTRLLSTQVSSASAYPSQMGVHSRPA